MSEAIISDCKEIERADVAAYADKRQVRSPDDAIIDGYANIYAWQLRDVTRLVTPRRFPYPGGAITWVRKGALLQEPWVGGGQRQHGLYALWQSYVFFVCTCNMVCDMLTLLN